MAKALVVVFLSAGLLAPDPCSLIPAATAASISSSKINTFMKLPAWMPTSVDETHTFGSDEHTNATRRTTFDTIAAVESIFDAYHERTFFMSEGRSNDWDTAKYGPRPSSAQALVQVEFTNFPHYASSIFVYRPAGTNATEYPRQVTDTRRLVEFGNLFSLADKITLDIFDDWSYGRGSYPGIFLPYKPTWTDEYGNRLVYPGSSWMPGNLAPENFDWREGFPDLQEWAFTNCCLPVWECAADGVFKTAEEYRSEYGYPHLHEYWLDTLDFGDLNRYGEGYLPKLTETRPWVTNTVPDIIRAKFPASGPEAGITNRTRRLVQDDYLTCDITNYYIVVAEPTVTVDFRGSRIGRTSSYQFHFKYNRIQSYSVTNGFISSMTLVSEPEEIFGLEDMISSSVVEMPTPPENYDFFRVGRIVRYPEGRYVSDKYTPITGMYAWDWNNPVLEATFKYFRLACVTNAVYTNSSVVATESRVLSMLDRSYEIAKPYSSAYLGYISSNRTQTVSASSVASGDAPVVYEFAEEEWIQGSSPMQVILRTSSGTVVPIELSQGPVTRAAETSEIGGRTDTRAKFRFSGVRTTLSPVIYYSTGFGVSINTNGVSPIAGTGFTYSLRPSAGGKVLCRTSKVGSTDFRDFEVELTVTKPLIHAAVNIGQSATLFTTTPAIRDSINRLYPWYGPGSLSFSTARVGDCYVSLCAAVERLVGKRQADGTFRDTDGWTSEFVDLDWYNYGDESSYSMKFFYSVTGERVVRNSAAAAFVARVLGDGGWARDGLISKCEDEMGVPFSPSMLNPSLSEVVRNAGRIAEYQGGYFYIECTPEGDECFPKPSSFGVGFAVDPVGETPELDYEKAFTAPVSADLLISDPLISTQWDWKALKSERNDK